MSVSLCMEWECVLTLLIYMQLSNLPSTTCWIVVHSHVMLLYSWSYICLFTCCFLWSYSSPFPCSSLMPSLVMSRYFVVYHFDSLLIYFTYIFLVISLMIALQVIIITLTYKNLVWIHTNLVSLIYKSSSFMQQHLLFVFITN